MQPVTALKHKCNQGSAATQSGNQFSRPGIFHWPIRSKKISVLKNFTPFHARRRAYPSIMIQTILLISPQHSIISRSFSHRRGKHKLTKANTTD